ncbi:MAG: hypothetical protein ACKPB4_24625 [Sphaerospermopsis kisseleviana]
MRTAFIKKITFLTGRALTAQIVMAAPEPSFQVTIEAAPEGDVGFSGDDLFEGATILEADNLDPASTSDPRDLFGGTFSVSEPGHVLGSDENAALGWNVKFATARPVTIGGFELFLGDDINGARGAKGFSFYQGDQLIASGLIDTPYAANYGNNQIKVTVKLDTPATGKEWMLELHPGPGWGVRALELDAISPAEAQSR